MTPLNMNNRLWFFFFSLSIDRFMYILCVCVCVFEHFFLSLSLSLSLLSYYYVRPVDFYDCTERLYFIFYESMPYGTINTYALIVR